MMGDARNIRHDRAPLCRAHIRVIAIIAAFTIFDGDNNFIPSYVIHFTRDTWGLSFGKAGFLVSSGLIGFMIGAMFNGLIADRFGRKPTLIAALVIAGTFSLMTGLSAHSFAVFIALRILTGIGIGVLLPLSTAYMNEIMPFSISNVTTIAPLALYNPALGPL